MDFPKNFEQTFQSLTIHAARTIKELQSECRLIEIRRDKLNKTILAIDQHFQPPNVDSSLQRASDSKKSQKAVIKFNIGGKKIDVRRNVMLSLKGTTNLLSVLCSERWGYLFEDASGRIFLDFDPAWVEPLINSMRESTLDESFDGIPAPFVSRENLSGFTAVSSYLGLDQKGASGENFLRIESSIPNLNEQSCKEQLKAHVLEAMFPEEWGKQVCLDLLYCGSRDGFGASMFHNHCDGKANTICVIEDSLGNVFGGFADVCWSQSDQYSTSTKSFLFFINPSTNFTVTKLSLLQSSAEHAVYHNPNYLCTFGKNHDLYVANNAQSDWSSYSCLGDTYSCDGGYINIMSGARRNFMVKEIEVYQVRESITSQISNLSLLEESRFLNFKSQSQKSFQTLTTDWTKTDFSQGTDEIQMPAFVCRILEHTVALNTDLAQLALIIPEYVQKLIDQNEQAEKSERQLLQELLFVEHMLKVNLEGVDAVTGPNAGLLEALEVMLNTNLFDNENGITGLIFRIEQAINRLYALEEAVLLQKIRCSVYEQSRQNCYPNGIVSLNIGGTVVRVHSDTLSRAPGSFLASQVAEGWTGHDFDEDGNIFLDVHPPSFLPIISYLRLKMLLGETSQNKIVVRKEEWSSTKRLLAQFNMNDIPCEML